MPAAALGSGAEPEAQIETLNCNIGTIFIIGSSAPTQLTSTVTYYPVLSKGPFHQYINHLFFKKKKHLQKIRVDDACM